MAFATRIFVLTGWLLVSSQSFAQVDSPLAVNALNQYYADLDSILANNRLSDVPFQESLVTVKSNDSLTKLAKKNAFDGLDFLHLSVAILQSNPAAFENGDPELIRFGAVIEMPDVRDLVNAKDQYEKINFVGNDLDFFHPENTMRQGLRYPFGREPSRSLSVVAQVNDPLVEWNVSLWGQRRAFTEHVEKLAELVASKTNNEFVLNLSYGGLSAPRENLDGIASGRFEMAQFCAGYHHDKNPSITVLELPFLGVNSLEQERNVSQWLYRHPAVIKDLERWNAVVLMPSPLPQYNIAGIGAAPRSLEDFAGLSIRATGAIGKAVAAVNAIPTPIEASEVQAALEENLIEAVAFAPHAHLSFGSIDRAEWWTTNLNPGTVNCPVVAGINAVNELDQRYRDALYSSINEALDHYIDNYNTKTTRAWGSALDRRGIERVTFSDTEINAFRVKVAGPAVTSWIAENSSKGLPAKELYDYVISALGGGNPELKGQLNTWSQTELASTPIVETNFAVLTENDDSSYLGAPRGGAGPKAFAADPLQNMVEWELEDDTTVGAALSRLAHYIGYEIIASNDVVIDNYKRVLPRVQTTVSEITVGDGFEVLSGAGFVTVFDHAARSITHLPKRNRQVKTELPECPADIGVASQSSQGVLLLSDGSECRY